MASLNIYVVTYASATNMGCHLFGLNMREAKGRASLYRQGWVFPVFIVIFSVSIRAWSVGASAMRDRSGSVWILIVQCTMFCGHSRLTQRGLQSCGSNICVRTSPNIWSSSLCWRDQQRVRSSAATVLFAPQSESNNGCVGSRGHGFRPRNGRYVGKQIRPALARQNLRTRPTQPLR